jgi:murein L,D-transpeptidase YafK
MKKTIHKIFILPVCFCFAFTTSFAQSASVDYSKSGFKVADMFSHTEENLRKQFTDKGMQWPAKFVYIRSFKFDAQVEVWVKNEAKEPYKLFKSYKICQQSGGFGPKRLQGDFQVPEGFYYINEFNPNSNYHLALGLNYPNTSDRILSDSLRPGGDIYIHGNCVSVGCIPVNDQQIEELYVISSYAKANGEDFIPVHVFPYKYTSRKAAEYFRNNTRNNQVVQKFATQLKSVFDRFEETKQLPVVLINKKGEYLVN